MDKYANAEVAQSLQVSHVGLHDAGWPAVASSLGSVFLGLFSEKSRLKRTNRPNGWTERHKSALPEQNDCPRAF